MGLEALTLASDVSGGYQSPVQAWLPWPWLGDQTQSASYALCNA